MTTKDVWILKGKVFWDIEANFVPNEWKYWYQLKDNLIGSHMFLYFMKKYALVFELFYFKEKNIFYLPK